MTVPKAIFTYVYLGTSISPPDAVLRTIFLYAIARFLAQWVILKFFIREIHKKMLLMVWILKYPCTKWRILVVLCGRPPWSRSSMLNHTEHRQGHIKVQAWVFCCDVLLMCESDQSDTAANEIQASKVCITSRSTSLANVTSQQECSRLYLYLANRPTPISVNPTYR